MIGGMVYVLNTGTRMSTKQTPLIDAATGIKLAATTAHLWFEEILSGDRHEEMNDVWELLDSADWYARAMLEGGRRAEQEILPLQDTGMREQIRRVRSKLGEFRSITGDRWRARQTSAAGTDIDQRYDLVFREFIHLCDDVKEQVQMRIADDIKMFRRVQLSLIGGAIGLGFLARVVFSAYINDRRRAESALRQREQEIRLTFENTPIAVAVLDAKMIFIDVNRALCSLLGRREEEMLGLPYLDVVHREDLEKTSRFLQQLTTGEISAGQFEHRYVKREGEVLHGLLHVGRIRETADHPARIVGQIVDRTEQVEAEEEAREHRERLAHVTRLNTMGEMAAGIAHEINQPLTAISASAQACERLIKAGRIDSTEQLAALEQISDSALRAGEVIRGLKAFARKDGSGRIIAHVNELVRDVVKLAETDARAARIRVDLEDALPAVVIDMVQIQQVVLNLIRNGLEAMQGGGAGDGELVVRTCRGEGREVEISVADVGIGIAEEIERNLFTPFHTTKEAGLGLGLSMSRAIITSHGGRLWFTRNEERGTTFHVSLPPVTGAVDERA
jgi:PAS domain S-box-containing protein